MPVTAPPEVQVVSDAPIIVQPTTRRARIKGTWTMYWGDHVFDFVEGQSYDIPADLFDYLRKSGNIFDTLA